MSRLLRSSILLYLTSFQYPLETLFFVHQALSFGGNLTLCHVRFIYHVFSGFLQLVSRSLPLWSSSLPQS